MNIERIHQYPRVLSIAGSDSGGGAGIQADLKTFAALGCFGMTAITALTAQNTCGVRAIHPVPPDMLRAQIDAVLEDIGADAVKVGMLHSPEIVRTVAQAIDRHQLSRVVFDPVMVATSGAKLIDDPAIAVLVAELFPRTALITPNLDEAALLVGRPLASAQDMAQAAAELVARGARAVLLKGGHLTVDRRRLDMRLEAGEVGQDADVLAVKSSRHVQQSSVRLLPCTRHTSDWLWLCHHVLRGQRSCDS